MKREIHKSVEIDQASFSGLQIEKMFGFLPNETPLQSPVMKFEEERNTHSKR